MAQLARAPREHLGTDFSHQAPVAAQGVPGKEDEFAGGTPRQDAGGAVAGGVIGAAAGAIAGGVIGAVVGGPGGAVIGAVAGGIIGGALGAVIGGGGGPTTFKAGPVHQVNNLADCVINGKDVGITWPTLNGAVFWSSPAVRAALARPVIKTSAAAGGGFDAQVDSVPANTGSFDETVLAPGPWTINTPKATIGARFPPLNMCAGAGNTTFQAKGDPSDAAMFTANRRHEDHHADDHKVAFNATILPWAVKLAAAKANTQKFHGAAAPAAEAALWAAVGGTPDLVADAFFNQCAAAVVAFHATPAGGAVKAPTAPGADAHCDNSWASYKNPS